MTALLNFLTALWQIMLELSLWLFLGAFLAGLLKLFLPKGFVKRHTGSGKISSIFKISLLGTPLPLCSCGVLPATIGIKKAGAGNGAAVGFLISTPQTGVDSILVTASFLGWPLALFKVLAAFFTGILGGLAVHTTEPRLSAQTATSETSIAAFKNKTPLSRWRLFWDFSVRELIGGIYQYLAIGLLVAALITVLFPANAFTNMPALQGLWGMLVMLAIAIPLYVCTTGSVPIVASLIAAGLPIGSALVFLMAGPATNAATLAAILKHFGKRITAIYLGTVVLGSIAFGLLFQSCGASLVSTTLRTHHEHQPLIMVLLNMLAAVCLTGLIGYWSGKDLTAWLQQHRKHPAPTDEILSLYVSGMTCKKCVAKIQTTLLKNRQITQVKIDLDTETVRISGHTLDEKTIIRHIQAAGYPAAKTKGIL